MGHYCLFARESFLECKWYIVCTTMLYKWGKIGQKTNQKTFLKKISFFNFVFSLFWINIMLNFHFFSYYRALWCTHAKIHAWLVTQGCKTITNFLRILLVISYNTHTILCINKVDSKSDLLTNLSGFRFVFSSQTTTTYYLLLLTNVLYLSKF